MCNVIIIERMDVYNDLDKRIIDYIRFNWEYSYPDRDKSMKFPINIHIARKYNNRKPYLVDTFLNELNDNQCSLFMKLCDKTSRELGVPIDFSKLVGNKVTEENYSRLILYKTIKKEIFEFLLNTLVDANNTSCHVHQVLYDRKKENKKLMYSKSKFSPYECCLEYLYQVMNDVQISKEDYGVVMAEFTTYVRAELENVLRLALTRVLIKNNMITETLKYPDAYKVVKRTVSNHPEIICNYIYKKSMNIAHMQKIFFDSGLRTLNTLTEICQSVMKKENEGRSGGNLGWKM